MTNAWVVRAGRHGENEQFNLDNSVATVSWASIGDLTPCLTREDVRAVVDEAYPAESLGTRANYTGQLWAFRDSIKPGDLVVLPSKLQSGYVRIGEHSGMPSKNRTRPDGSNSLLSGPRKQSLVLPLKTISSIRWVLFLPCSIQHEMKPPPDSNKWPRPGSTPVRERPHTRSTRRRSRTRDPRLMLRTVSWTRRSLSLLHPFVIVFAPIWLKISLATR